jgi:two-component system chemotaxis response regulator CheV
LESRKNTYREEGEQMVENNKSNILLESGTNEIEVMRFSVSGEFYGINVAKVQEIIMAEKVKPMPHSHPAVEGIFKPREELITVINLVYYLFGESREHGEKDLFIITNFNRMTVAFRVESIEGISRISWGDIQKPDKTISNGNEGVATGIAQCEGQLVTILDFEKIVAEIAPETTIQVSDVEKLGARPICDSPIVIAEDSMLLQKMIDDCLERAGFTHLINFSNGQEAWDYLHSIKNDSDLYDKVNLVITDIEMPKMDGHRLTKLIKDDPRLRHLPVIIFSSLIDEQMRIKGKELGADEQIAKPEIGHLVGLLDMMLGKFNELRPKLDAEK